MVYGIVSIHCHWILQKIINKHIMLKVNAKTKLFGVLADPIEHVRAPDIYNEKWIYNNKNQLMIPIHVKKENLQQAIEGLRSLSNFYGFCVTIPHKVDIAKYCDILLPNAEMIGAVNVAYFNKKRELIGNNFDGDGFISGLKSQGHDVTGKRIFLAGAGGASRAIAFSLAKNQVYSIYIINRTEETASDLCNSVLKWYPDLDIKLYKDFSECDILINTTSLGLKESDELPFDVEKSSSSSLIADIIMKPEMTRLLNKAKLINRKIHLGKHMLDYQIELMENFLTKDI